MLDGYKIGSFLLTLVFDQLQDNLAALVLRVLHADLDSVLRLAIGCTVGAGEAAHVAGWCSLAE